MNQLQQIFEEKKLIKIKEAYENEKFAQGLPRFLQNRVGSINVGQNQVVGGSKREDVSDNGVRMIRPFLLKPSLNFPNLQITG